MKELFNTHSDSLIFLISISVFGIMVALYYIAKLQKLRRKSEKDAFQYKPTPVPTEEVEDEVNPDWYLQMIEIIMDARAKNIPLNLIIVDDTQWYDFTDKEMQEIQSLLERQSNHD